jgi:hypothetical protein
MSVIITDYKLTGNSCNSAQGGLVGLLAHERRAETPELSARRIQAT